MPDLDAPDPDAANAPFRGDAILIADPSPEGAAIADALRMRGFIAIELAPEHLDARAIAESPRAVVVDIDHLGAIEAVERLRDLSVGVIESRDTLVVTCGSFVMPSPFSVFALPPLDR